MCGVVFFLVLLNLSVVFFKFLCEYLLKSVYSVVYLCSKYESLSLREVIC